MVKTVCMQEARHCVDHPTQHRYFWDQRAWFIIVSINHCFIIAVNQPANRRNASRSRGLCINGWTACQEDGEEKMVGVLVMTSMMLRNLETLQHRFQCSQSNLSNAFCDQACRSQIFSTAYGTGSWYVLWYQSMIIIMDLKDLYRVLSTRCSLTTCLAQVIQLKCIMHYDCRSWLQPFQSTDTKCPRSLPMYTLVSDLVWGASHELGLSSVKSDLLWSLSGVDILHTRISVS